MIFSLDGCHSLTDICLPAFHMPSLNYSLLDYYIHLKSIRVNSRDFGVRKPAVQLFPSTIPITCIIVSR